MDEGKKWKNEKWENGTLDVPSSPGIFFFFFPPQADYYLDLLFRFLFLLFAFCFSFYLFLFVCRLLSSLFILNCWYIFCCCFCLCFRWCWPAYPSLWVRVRNTSYCEVFIFLYKSVLARTRMFVPWKKVVFAVYRLDDLGGKKPSSTRTEHWTLWSFK